MNPDPRIIHQLNAVNVVVGDHGRQIIHVGGQAVVLPSRDELLAYAAAVQSAYARWADQPDQPDPPLYAQSDDPDTGPDSYISTQAVTLPMRVAEFRPLPGETEPQAQELLAAVGQAQRTVILGEPGSGKTTALERLAWVTATETLSGGRPRIPILARLSDYRSEADLIPLLRRSLRQYANLDLGDTTVWVLLAAKDTEFVILLDGLNELPQQAIQENLGPGAIAAHLADYPAHTVHVTCRTADFDPPQMTPEGAQLWTVQPLADQIRYWGDPEGHSDVREYLRRHLGESRGQRLYERLRSDDRLRDLARLPLFLFMLKEAGGEGELPTDRGGLVRSFIRSRRVLGRIPQGLRDRAERTLEALGRELQGRGGLELLVDDLYQVMEQVRGRQSYQLDTMCDHLQATGLLIYLGEERYRLLHQMVQEYAAAAHLARQTDCGNQIRSLAQDEWWRESCILALWLRQELHDADYLLGVMGDPAVDLRVRVAAADILAEIGDPRFVRRPVLYQGKTVSIIEPQMIPIPGGVATLGGADPDAERNELPACPVEIAPFDLAVYPVTNAEYACFVEAEGYADESLWTEAGRQWLRGEGKLDPETEQYYRDFHQALNRDVEGFITRIRSVNAMSDQDADIYRRMSTWGEDEFISFWERNVAGDQRREPRFWSNSLYNRPNQPVVGVNWYEAMAYAAWLSRVTGRAYRLPSEAEWEWAARRQHNGQDRRYPWGDEWDADRCNSNESRLGRPSPVGVYPHGITPDGLHDLAGNVYEWTSTRFAPYPYDPQDGREDPENDGRRSMRGGSWFVNRTRVRCGFRSSDLPWYWGYGLGFRLARTSL